eukprot:5559180-Amphidinium_carterae.1
MCSLQNDKPKHAQIDDRGSKATERPWQNMKSIRRRLVPSAPECNASVSRKLQLSVDLKDVTTRRTPLKYFAKLFDDLCLKVILDDLALGLLLLRSCLLCNASSESKRSRVEDWESDEACRVACGHLCSVLVLVVSICSAQAARRSGLASKTWSPMKRAECLAHCLHRRRFQAAANRIDGQDCGSLFWVTRSMFLAMTK